MLDELPPGRTPVVTRSLQDERRFRYGDFAEGIRRRPPGYLVYPVIEENEEREMKAAQQMHRQLREKIFPTPACRIASRASGRR